eukprot:m.107662 g.107662  ORF g.107662 m.107662 type:complete len:426 (+) comp21168_c0_seq1:680-1957(+)
MSHKLSYVRARSQLHHSETLWSAVGRGVRRKEARHGVTGDEGGISLPEVGSGERGECGSMQQSQLVLPSPTMEEEGKGLGEERGAAVGTPPRPLTPGMPGPAVPRWQHSAEIREAIREKMLSRTYEHVPPPSFLSTGDITPYTRSRLAQWLLSVCEHCQCNTSVFTTCMMYVDKFLWKTPTTPARLQLLGSAALLLATKLVGDPTISVKWLCASSDDLFTAADLTSMEIELLTGVDWMVFTFGPHDYLCECLADLGEKWGMCAAALRGLLHDAEIYVDICYLDHILVTHGPAAVAAVSIEYALRSCTRGALLLYPSATVCDLAILPSTVKDMMHDLLLLLDQLSRSVLGEPAAAAPHPLEPAAAVDAPQSPVAAAVVSDVANEPFTPPNVVLPTHKRPAPSPEASSSRRRRKNHSLQPQRLLDEA